MAHATLLLVLCTLLVVHTARGAAQTLALGDGETLRRALPVLVPNSTLLFEVAPSATDHALLVEVHMPAFPSAHSNRARALLSISSGNRTRRDSRAFRRAQSVLFVVLGVRAQANATISLKPRGVEGGKNGQSAVLFVRRESSMAQACPGYVPNGVRTCNGRGRCRMDDNGARCDCARGVYGDFCNEWLRAAPQPTQRPRWDGEVRALPESAVVRLSGGEVYAFAWRGSGSAFARARVLMGGLVGGPESDMVGGGGGEVGMACGKRGGELPSVGRGAATSSVVRQEGGGTTLLELVCQTEEEVRRAEWVVSLWARGGDGATVSLQVRACGRDAREDCPLQRGGFAWGAVVAAVCVAVVVVAVVGALLVVVRMRRRRTEAASRTDAWEWQRVGFIRVPSRRRLQQPPQTPPSSQPPQTS